MLAELAAGRICHSDPAEAGEESLTVYPVFIRHGLVWEETELRHLRQFLHVVAASPARGPSHPPRRRFAATIQNLTILDLPVRDVYGKHWSTTGRRVPDAATPDDAVYLPGRNLLLLSKAAVFCARHKINVIAVGSLGHNPFADATPRFFREFAAAASDALGHRLKIIAPFRSLTKEQVIRRGARLNLPLHLSFSCIAPKHGRHCGRCNKCAERQRAFRQSGVMDKTSYL
jgi:7-cyano-7-deazaguanine synthase